MQETAQQYIKRMLKTLGERDSMAVLSSTPRNLARLLRGASGRKLTTRPQPGKWSVAEILAHLADAELVVAFRIRLILGSNRTTIQAYDQDAWADFSRYRDHDPRLSLEAFRVQRERNVRLLRSLPKIKWGYYGVHSERGKETIRQLARMTAGHDINHLNQIRRLVQGEV